MWKTITRAVLWSTAAIAFGIALWWVWIHPNYLTWEFWQSGRDGEIQSSRSEVVRNLGLLFLGLVGLAFGVWRAILALRNQKSIEEGQITERFTKAVEQLGSPELAVRQGAIHALWRIAEDSPKRDFSRVLDVLCSYVRNAGPPASESEELETLRPSSEIITIIELLKTCSPKLEKLRWSWSYSQSFPRVESFAIPIPYSRKRFWRRQKIHVEIDLSNSYLPQTDFSSTSLIGWKFDGADLRHSRFDEANIVHSKFIDANLRYSSFDSCRAHNLLATAADFSHSQLTASYFSRFGAAGAMFPECSFFDSHLTHSFLIDANFHSCSFEKVHLSDTLLLEAQFEEANLSGLVESGSETDSIFDYGTSLDSAWAWVDHPPQLLRPEAVKSIRFFSPELRGHNETFGFPKGVPSEGMAENEVITYWDEHGWPDHIPRDYFETKNDS